MNDLVEDLVFDIQLFADGEPFDPWGEFNADDESGDDDEPVTPVDPSEEDTIETIPENKINDDVINEDGTIDEDAISEGDIVRDGETQATAEEVLGAVSEDSDATSTVIYSTTQAQTSSGTNYTQITGVAGIRIKAKASGSGASATLGSGSKRTKIQMAASSNVDVMFEYDSTTNSYSTDPTEVRAQSGSVFEVGGAGMSFEGDNPMTVNLSNGKPSLLSILANAVIKIGTALFGSGDVLYDTDTTVDGVTIDFNGFAPADENKVIPTSNGKKVDTIDIANTEDATVTVDGSYAYTFAMHDSDGLTVSSEEFALDNVTDTSEYTFEVLSDNGLKLDLRGVEAKNASKPVSLAEAGGADVLLPPTATDGEIKISGTTYGYTTVADSEGGFLLNGEGEAVAFFLGSTGDAFRVAAGSDFLVYDADDLENELTSQVTATGGDVIFTKTAADYTLGYVFTSAGDSITLTDDQADNFEMFYKNKRTEYDVIEPEIEGGYTVTMTAANTFVISDLEEGAEVTIGDATIEFENAGGSVTLTAAPNSTTETATLSIAGVKATSGKIDFDDEAAALLADGVEINGQTVKHAGMDAFTYDADKSVIQVDDDTVYAVGDGTFTFNNNKYTVAGDKDGLVEFTLDENGNVTAIDDLNGGKVTGALTGLAINDQIITATSEGDITVTGNDAGTGITGTDFADKKKGEDTLTPDDDDENVYSGTFDGNTVTVVVDNDHKDGREIKVIRDINGKITVTGILSGDTVTLPNDGTVLLTSTKDGTDTLTINGVTYTVMNDQDGTVKFTGDKTAAGGITVSIDDLDEDAAVHVSFNEETPFDIKVNGQTYTGAQVDGMADNEWIISYLTKAGAESSYMQEKTHPIISSTTPFISGTRIDILHDALKMDEPPVVASESGKVETHASLTSYDFTTDERKDKSALVYLDTSIDNDVVFNDKGGNIAVVGQDPSATGDYAYADEDIRNGIGTINNSTKNITLGNRNDAVIVRPEASDGYSKVNITGGTGADTVVVQGSMPVTFDMSKGGADKVLTYATANARITLDGYSDDTGAGIVIHEPEALNIASAIEGGLLMFEDGKVVTIDRDETDRGVDRKTEIVVNNKNADHQTLVRLFTAVDNKDSYKDDKGQLVGFTGSDGGKLDASDKSDDLILIGNTSGKKDGSELIAGKGDDTIYAGKGDIVNAGDGDNLVKLSEDGGANVVVGAGNTTINNLTTGFEGDVIAFADNVSLNDVDVSFDGSNISIKGSGYSAVASVTPADAVNQLFKIGEETVKAAIAVDGQDISVSGSDIPTYFFGNAGVDFTNFSGDVVVDAKGNWNPTSIDGNNAFFSPDINSLKGGSGTTQFKGGEEDDYLVAGTGATSLYGGGGNNTLVGNASQTAATEFFVLGNQNETGGKNLIKNFQFGTDFINTDVAANYISKVTVEGGTDVKITVTNREKPGVSEVATIEGAVDAGNIKIGTAGGVAAVGQINTDVATVDGEADYLAATVAGGATVKVSSDLKASTGIWLDNRGDKWFSDNFAVIDATESTAEVTLAGDAKSNTIFGGLGNASLWGGSGSANDLLVGGSALNSFYYEQGNGADTIDNAGDGDIVNLFDTSLENITSAAINSTGVALQFNNGGSLTINSNADVNYRLADGSIYTADHANHTWTKKS
ncbi:MAG: hypothetical protein IJQ01_09755 [Selenomonadaceae bacterium]|nr:hypothetical protein [Selenomonadaceae bacterium]